MKDIVKPCGKIFCCDLRNNGLNSREKNQREESMHVRYQWGTKLVSQEVEWGKNKRRVLETTKEPKFPNKSYSDSG